MRTLIVMACFVLAGCSYLQSDDTSLAPAYVEPLAPTPEAQLRGAKLGAAEEKLAAPLEVSGVIKAERGLGRWMVCVRGARPGQPVGYYSVYFDNELYRGVREAVVYDFCSQQSYQPLG
jgi:hypothetical protein